MVLDPSSVEETLRRVSTEDNKRGPLAKLRLSIPKALTSLRRRKTDLERAASPALDAASTCEIYDGISSFSPQLKKMSKHTCQMPPMLAHPMSPATATSSTNSSLSDTIGSHFDPDRSPASEYTRPASYVDDNSPGMIRAGILPDVSPGNETFAQNVTFRDDGTKAKTWADYCAEHTKLKSYDAAVAAAAAAELLEHRTGASILTPGPVEAVDRFPLTPRAHSDLFQTGIESPTIDKAFPSSDATCEPSTTKTDRTTKSANEKASPARTMTNQASELEKPGKAKKPRRDSTDIDNTATRPEYNDWKDLTWEDKRRERGILTSELSQWNFDDASQRPQKTPSTPYGPKWEVSDPLDLCGLGQQPDKDDYFAPRKSTACTLRTSVTPNLTRQEDITEYIKNKFQAHADQMEARAHAVPYSHPCTGRPSRDFSAGEILERENNSSASEFNRSRDLRDNMTDRKLSGSPRDSKFCRTTIHADLSPPLSRGQSIGLPDCSQDPMVRAAGFEKVSSRTSAGGRSKLEKSVGSPGRADASVGKAPAFEKQSSRGSQQQSAQPGLVKVRNKDGETLQLGGKE